MEYNFKNPRIHKNPNSPWALLQSHFLIFLDMVQVFMKEGFMSASLFKVKNQAKLRNKSKYW